MKILFFVYFYQEMFSPSNYSPLMTVFFSFMFFFYYFKICTDRKILQDPIFVITLENVISFERNKSQFILL